MNAETKLKPAPFDPATNFKPAHLMTMNQTEINFSFLHWLGKKLPFASSGLKLVINRNLKNKERISNYHNWNKAELI